jgi:hypothetical protein
MERSMAMMRKLAFQVMLALVVAGSVWAAPTITIGSASIAAGSPSVTVPVTLTNEPGTSISLIQLDIGYDTTFFGTPSATAGAATVAAGGKTVQASAQNGVLTVLISGGVSVLPDGVVASVTLPLNVASGSTGLNYLNSSSFSDPALTDVLVNGMNGTVTINTNATLTHIINGSVRNTTGSAGRVFVVLTGSGGNNGGTGLGTTITSLAAGATGSFSIHGVPPGTYGLGAFIDVNNTGTLHAYDPSGGTAADLTLVNTDITFPQFDIATSTAAAPVFDPSAKVNVAATSGGVLVQWDTPKAQLPGGGPNAESATSYTIFWGTSPNPGNGSTALGNKPVTATENNNVVINGLTNGQSLHFTVKAINSAGSAAISTSTPITINAPTGLATVSGNIYTTGITKPNGSLYVALSGSTGFYIARPTTGVVANPQPWSMAGIPPGTYTVYAVLDMNGDGVVGNGDIQNGNGNAAPTITIVGTTAVTAPSITLTNANAQPAVTTSHFSNGNYDNYSLELRVRGAIKRPVAVAVSGPGLSSTTDLGVSLNNEGFQYWLNLSTPPVVGDSYPFTITYSDASTETITATVSAVLGQNFTPTFIYPANSTGPDSVSPLLSWRTPQWLPGYYNYRVQVNGNSPSGGQIWSPSDRGNNLPLSQLSIPFNSDGSANPSALSTGTNYNWNVSLTDGYGNQAQSGWGFTPQSTGPAVSGFSPTIGGAGTSVAITGSNFTGVTAVVFGGVAASSFTVNSTSSITATVPSGATVGPVTVTAGGVTASSSTTFYATVTYSGTVTDSASPANNISGATVAAVDPSENVLTNPSGSLITTTTASNGTYSLTVPSGVPFALRINKTGFNDVTTSLMSPAQNDNSTYILHTAASLTALTPTVTLASGKGVIVSQVIDWDTNANVTGATIAANSFLHQATPYASGYTSGSSTSSDGRFIVNGVDEGDYVAVSASFAGWGFQPRVYITHAGDVSENKVRGTPLPTVTVSPSAGTYNGAQNVTLSTDATRPAGTIYYTTNGNDPKASGANPVVYSGPISISNPGTVTLKFYARNSHGIDGPVGSAAYTIKATSSTGVGVNTATVTYGQPAGAFANVSPSGATGTVQFKVDGTVCGSPVSLSGGSATIDLHSACSNLITVSGSPHAISADYSGDGTYQPSSGSANPGLTVFKANQTITFTGPITKTYGNPAFNPATATSGLGVTYSSDNTSVATGGSSITIVGSGTANITASQTGDSNYNAAAPVNVQLTVNKATLTVTGITANNKVYDGGTSATLNFASAAFAGVIGSDAVTLNTGGAAATFADKNVGTGKTVTISGLSLNGAAAGKYLLNQPTATANITSFALTVTGITANTKTYDRTTSASLNLGAAALSGVIGGDAVTINIGSASGAFIDKNVGTGKTVNVSGLTLGGGGASNYTVTQPTATATITAKQLTVTGIVANNKIYDATVTASLNTGSAALAGVIAGDTVTIFGTATGTFADKNVGSGKTVTIAGLALAGVDAGNYTVATVTSTANITAKGVTVTGLTASNKTYDATTAATLSGTATANGLINGDVVSLTGTAVGAFADKNVGTGKAVAITGLSLIGADATNYSLTAPTATATITAKSVTVSGLSAANKTYDRTTAATLSGTATANGFINGDVVSLVGTAAGAFSDKNVGTGKTVTVTGLSLTGADATNYSLSAITVTADITAKQLTVTGIVANNRVYDATVTASLNTASAALAGVIAGDTVTISGTATGTFADKNVGSGKTVTIAGLALAGADAGNYSVATVTSTANITAKGVTITGLTASNKTYDATTAATLSGTATANGLINGDVVSLTGTAVGAFADKNVGTGKAVGITGLSLTGADATNYSLTAPTATATATITTKSVTVSGLSAANKTYDGNTTAAISGTAATTDFINGDAASLSGAAVGAFNTKTAGSSKAVTITGLAITGADAGNYSLAAITLAADVTAKQITVTGIIVNNKVYDATVTATLNTAGAALSGVVVGDVVTISGTATGTFGDKNVGTGKTVTIAGVALAGADAGNYTVAPVTGSANIVAATLTVAATDASIVYGDAVPSLTYTITGFVGTENSSLVTGSPAESTTATTGSGAGSYPVTVTQGTLSAPNYVFGFDNGTLLIRKASATVTLGTLAFTFDGTTKSTTTTVSPSGLTVSLFYNGSATSPSVAGTYTVLAVVNDANYEGGATGIMTITKTVAPSTVPGDLNGDGKVDQADALIALRISAGLDSATPAQLSLGDVAPLDSKNKPTPDGVIDIADVVLILKKAVNLVTF